MESGVVKNFRDSTVWLFVVNLFQELRYRHNLPVGTTFPVFVPLKITTDEKHSLFRNLDVDISHSKYSMYVILVLSHPFH